MFTLAELFEHAYEVGQVLAWYSLGYLGLASVSGYNINLSQVSSELSAIVYAQDLQLEDYDSFIPLPDWYQVWIQSGEDKSQYLAVLFDRIEFLEGFRQACVEAQVDFRSLIWGLPMRREGDVIVYYTWRGYDFKQPRTSHSPVAREGWYQGESYENHRERTGSETEPI